MNNIPKVSPPKLLDDDRKNLLSQLIPESVEDGKINVEKIKESLGEFAEDEAANEHFELSWPGKREAKKVAITASKGTLVPAPGEGVDEDKTKNLFIEGENLEVLKLLHKSYIGQIKMIYIDPPYNTGKDFVYSDKFSDSIEEYRRVTGQVDSEGREMETNKKSDGRFHSRWLSMMYPRLKIAKDFLSNDGIMFISIDENEAQNLKVICNEIFGEENLLSTHHIQVRYGNKSLNERKDFQELIEYVFIYAKDKSFTSFNKPKEDYPVDKFNLEINHDQTPSKMVEENGRKVDIWLPGSYSIKKVTPSTEMFKETWISGSILTGTGHGKMYLKVIDKRRKIDGNGCLYRIHGIGEDGLGYRYYTNPKVDGADRGKMYTKIPTKVMEELNNGGSDKESPIINFYDYSGDFGNIRQEGDIPFNGGKKPVKMIKNLMNYLPEKDYTILDFFAGSSSTAHACTQMNSEDGGDRKFIMVQLPEQINREDKVLIDIAKEINKPPTITSISMERIRRAGKKIKDETKADIDYGFKVFKLQKSNYRDQNEMLQQGQINMDFADLTNPLVKGWKPEDLLTEVTLLEGFPLDSKVKQLSEIKTNKVQVISCDDPNRTYKLFVCLDDKIDPQTIAGLTFDDEDKFICLDSAIGDTDKLTLSDKTHLKVI